MSKHIAYGAFIAATCMLVAPIDARADDAHNGLVARYSAAGTVDDGFNGTGFVLGAAGTRQRGVGVRSGKIVVAGAFTADGVTRLVVGRYNSDGTVDTSFGFAGITTATFNLGSDIEEAGELVFDSLGRILVTGHSLQPGGTITSFVMRFQSTGVLDTSYGSNGFAPVCGQDYYITALGKTTDSKPVLVCSKPPDPNGTPIGDMRVVRLGASGNEEFNTAVSFSATSERSIGYDLAVDTSNRIVVTGKTPNGLVGVLRVNASGALDNGFGTSGRKLLNVGVSAVGTGVAIDKSGRIVVAATPLVPTAGNVHLVRLSNTGATGSTLDYQLTADPDPDGSLRQNQFKVRPIPGTDNVYVAGTGAIAGQQTFVIAKILGNTFTHDPNYGTGGRVSSPRFNRDVDLAEMTVDSATNKPVLAGCAGDPR